MRNDPSLSPAEIQDLRCIADIMIPPSEIHAVPGAGDPAILADIIASLGRDFDAVRQALSLLATLSGGAFADLDTTSRTTVATAFQTQGGAPLAALNRTILQCYYRDDRVVRSLGLEPRPPFPKGHSLEQGDWSLLDPVRTRPPMWRDVPAG
ncbi:MAG TPA: hypothetical protein VFG12_08320 [Rhodopila sp.]|jgi:hypothetical protein|nr:hypothetical protein [Rhodopila sp.]